MDIVRPEIKRKKQIRRIIYACVGLVLVVAITVGLKRLKPAAPGVDKATLWPDTVQRGSMVIDVRGLGILAPEKINFVSAPADGIVKDHMLAGVSVKPDTVIMDYDQSDAGAADTGRGIPVEGCRRRPTNKRKPCCKTN